nr:retrovirus-related Pol polyprotein from transposon TNT 1-94 [Tanacetum cinerariifolium]
MMKFVTPKDTDYLEESSYHCVPLLSSETVSYISSPCREKHQVLVTQISDLRSFYLFCGFEYDEIGDRIGFVVKKMPTKDFEAKYNNVKAKPALLSLSALASKAVTVKNKDIIAETYEWDKEEGSSDDNEMVEVKVLMALAEDNAAISKEEQPRPNVVFRDDSTCITEGYGSTKCNGIFFTKVAFVNGLKYNLISISQLCNAKYIVQFDEKRETIFNSNKEVVMIAPRVRDVYVIDMTSSAQESCLFAKASNNLNCLWHKRPAHLNFKTINKLEKKNYWSSLTCLVKEQTMFIM